MTTVRFVDTEELNVRNPLILQQSEADSTFSDTYDIGFLGKYYNGANVAYTGLYRKASDTIFKLFSGLQTSPDVKNGVINDTTDPGYTLASLDLMNLHAFGDTLVEGSLTVNGPVTALNVETMTVEANLIIANSGPADMQPDAGFVVRRQALSVATDDNPLISNFASASGTTTTVTLAVGSPTGLNYYQGWIISLHGDVTLASATVVSSTNTSPPTLTFDTAATAITTTSTIYRLYNEVYIGSIWDESAGFWTAYGFPRNDGTGAFSMTAADGNTASLMSTKALDIHAAGDVYIDGVIKASVRMDDNIISANVGPSNQLTDGGFVSRRTPLSVITGDTAKMPMIAISSTYGAGSALINITTVVTGNNYFEGWVIRYNADTVSPSYVLSSADNGDGTHTLTMWSAFPISLTSGVDTVDLYNRGLVGMIYHEASNTMMGVGFPREVGESVISPTSPVNGNIPDYIDLAIHNLTLTGTLSVPGSNLETTETITASATYTLTAPDIMNYDIIYLNPTANISYILPTTAALSISANRSKQVQFVNISSFSATITAGGSDTIEGLTSLRLLSLYSKTVLTATDQVASTWFIKG
jgi:hypothetical protein